MAGHRTPQLRSAFTVGDPQSGYYNDLTAVARQYGQPDEAASWVHVLSRRREIATPVSILQLGLGAWQLSSDNPAWKLAVREVVEWVLLDMDARGRLAHYFDMPHTYDIAGPWYSAMAQGQAVSLLVRAAHLLDAPELMNEASRAATWLLDEQSELIVVTADGPVLQEYATNPHAAHVLNGWIFGLWGLYDLAMATGSPFARDAFDEGVATLRLRLGLYDAAGWSRYDLFPHPIVHVASPFYHRLHIEQLRVMNELAPSAEFVSMADRWEASAANRLSIATAIVRKVGFRLLRPRRRVA